MLLNILLSLIVPERSSFAERPSLQLSDNAHTLPQEMIDYVIDFLHDDKHSLALCGLASRLCVTSCRHHLYNTLGCRSCDAEESGDWPSFAYISLFFKTHKHLQIYVRDIRIVSKTNDRICLCVVSSILSTLPSLHAFTIDNVSLTSCQCCIQPTPPHIHNDVLSLNFRGTYSPTSLNRIINLLRLFPAARKMSIQAVRLYAVGEGGFEAITTRELALSPINHYSGLTQLAMVAVRPGMVSSFVHIFDSWHMLGDMKDLRVMCYNWDDFHPILRIIKRSSKTLNRLILDVSAMIHHEVCIEGNGELHSTSCKSS